ncbi:glutamate-5-semialdehyde dehydrogenase [bacterium]|nr:glutamate-5-semialdehyde dehydrogenase [bacterium]
MPSVGKSTLISKISASKPKIAAYHFTTLSPNLGVVRVSENKSFVVADLPGLIEGASLGEGLGDKFLKHIERTRVIAHVIDMSGYEGRNPYDDYVTINHELENFGHDLMKKPQIVIANKMDLELAKPFVENGELSQSVFNRLKLDENKMRDMIQGIIDISNLEDPIGKTLLKRQLDDGLILTKISCPIGVLGIIFEARPDVISQISSLAIKSSNAVILKGGKESINTNKAIMNVIQEALAKTEGFPENVLTQVFTRDDVKNMLSMDKYIDLIIPRGGNNLVKFIKENTKIPVLGHADGICHIFVDASADLEKSKRVIIDAKTQYPSACNSVETILIHKDFKYETELLKALEDADIELIATPESWHEEYSDKVLSYKFVSSLEEAIEHINEFSSGHTESILTEDENNAKIFMNAVDSAGVYHNVSTRFADGFRYGFGAEVGISTNKTHARGPVGLEGLTIYKYSLEGNGDIVKDYVEGVKKFNHKDI